MDAFPDQVSRKASGAPPDAYTDAIQNTSVQGLKNGLSGVPVNTPAPAPAPAPAAAPVDPYTSAIQNASMPGLVKGFRDSMPPPAAPVAAVPNPVPVAMAPNNGAQIESLAKAAAARTAARAAPAGPGQMAPASGGFVAGLNQVGTEAGGGATGAGAMTRDIGGQILTGAAKFAAAPIVAPAQVGVSAIKTAGNAIASPVADFARGLAGDVTPAPPAAAGAPAAPAAAPGAAPITPATPDIPIAANAAPAPAGRQPFVVSLGRRGDLPPGVSMAGNSYSNVPAASTLTTAAAAAPAAAPAPMAAPAAAPAPAGSGYGATGFTADGGRGGGSAAVSAALAAAAGRGDFDAVANHYQAGGGTFNGTTGAQDTIARLNKQVAMSPAGSRAQKSAADQRDAVGAQAAAAGAAKRDETRLGLEKTKVANDTAKTGAEVAQSQEATAGAKISNAQKLQVQGMIKQLADLDGTTDPDGKKRAQLSDSILAIVHGKDASDNRYMQMDEDTGTTNPLTNAPNVIKRIFNKQSGSVVPQPPAPPKYVEGQSYKDASGNKAVYKGGKFVPA